MKKEAKKEKKKVCIDINDDYASKLSEHLREKDSTTIFDEINPDTTIGYKKVIYSGLPDLDRIISFKEGTKINGIPLCAMIECYGKESSGKTSFFNYMSCIFLKAGGLVINMDFEHKFSPKWFITTAKHMGVTKEDLKRYIYKKPEHFEWFVIWLIKTMKMISTGKKEAREALAELEKKKNKPSNYKELKERYEKILDMPYLIIVDSIANMYTQAEIEDEETTSAHMAELARGFSAKLKFVRRQLSGSDVLILWGNQERDDIGNSRFRLMTTPGGHATKSNCEGRIHFRRGDKLKRTRSGIEIAYGSIHHLKITKNQMGVPPFREVELLMLYDRGYYSFNSIIDVCAEVGIINKTGSKFTINAGGKIGKIEFEKGEMEEIEKQYPKLEGILHSMYQKWMEKK
jgi:RecA/RadA recombinase